MSEALARQLFVPVDIICGGFPCQDVSSAGKRAGLAGARSGLWFEYLRIVSELQPSWVVVENVASGARAWVDVVVEGLEQLGYACLPVPLAAADVGAPHERARVFIVAANAHAQGEPSRSQHAEVACAQATTDIVCDQLRVESGRSSRHERRGQAQSAVDGEAVANTNALRWPQGRRRKRNAFRHANPNNDHWREPMPDMVRMVSRIPRGLDGTRARISALGNSVVPQCAEVIGHLIAELSS